MQNEAAVAVIGGVKQRKATESTETTERRSRRESAVKREPNRKLLTARQAASNVTFRPSAESTELRLDKRGLPSREKSRYKLSRFNLLNSAARATPPCASTTSRRPTGKTSGPSS